MEPLIDQAPAAWPVVPLGEVCDILAGPGGKRLPALERTDEDQPARGDLVPVVTPREIRRHRITAQASTAVSPGIANGLARYRVRPGDIVAVRTGELGQHALAGDEHDGWLLGTSCLRIRPRGEAVDTGYLLFYLSHPQIKDWIVRNGSGSNPPSLAATVLEALPTHLPPLDHQVAVAEVLSALDERAEQLGRAARTAADLLEAAVLPLMAGVPIDPP
ncbi:restriction endonuclease subunit S [Amycolatopsis sp. NPDC051128]|uniref:restriction endonuclease subunit S n=1 Tax=Amycolatopsis sp. NPDC051128 TaxID=3155412 RepID=UPI0034404CCA